MQQTAPMPTILCKAAGMLDLNVIEPSTATEYSQLHLQAKPDGKWQFCTDLRNLILASKGRGWPIPNIPQMLRRIGDHHTKYFVTTDMTRSFKLGLVSSKLPHMWRVYYYLFWVKIICDNVKRILPRSNEHGSTNRSTLHYM